MTPSSMVESRNDEWVDFSTNTEFQPFVEKKQAKNHSMKQNLQKDELIVPNLSLPLNHYCMIAEKVFISFLKSFRGLYTSSESIRKETVSTLGKRLLLFVNIVIPTHEHFHLENYTPEKKRMHSIVNQVTDYLDKLHHVSTVEERDDVEDGKDVEYTPIASGVLSPNEFREYCMPCSDSPSVITVDESFESFYSEKVYEENEEFEVVHSSSGVFDNEISSVERNEIELVDVGVCDSWETCSFDSIHVVFGSKMDKDDVDDEGDDFGFGILPDVESTSSVSSSNGSNSNESTSNSSSTSTGSTFDNSNDGKVSEMNHEIDRKASNFSALMNHWKAKEKEWKQNRVK